MENTKPTFFMPRYRSDRKIEPKKFYKYELDVSRAERDTDIQVYINAYERYLNKYLSKENYYAVDNGLNIFTEKEIKKEHLTYSYTYNSSTMDLLLHEIDYTYVELSEKEVYRKYISLVICNLLIVNGYSRWTTEPGVFFKNLHRNFGFFTCVRRYDYQIHLDDENYFNIFVNMKTELKSTQNILEIYKDKKIKINIYDKNFFVENIRQDLSKKFTGYLVEGFSDTISQEFRTREGLINYFKKRYKIDIQSPDDDFAVEMRRSCGSPTTFLASMLRPVLTLDNIASMLSSEQRKILRNIYTINIKPRMEESTTAVNDIIKNTQLNIACNPKTHRPQPQQTIKYNLKPEILKNPNLLIKNNYEILCNKKRYIFNNGFYTVPFSFSASEPLKLALVLTSNKIKEEQACRVMKKIFSYGFYNSIPENALKYEIFTLDEKMSELDFVGNIKHSFEPHLALVIIDAKKSIPNEEDEEVYPQLKRAFADNRYKIPSQMLTQNTADTILNTNNGRWYAENIIMGLLGKLGCIPYVLAEKDVTVDLYIGIDVGMQEKNIHLPTCATACMGEGKFIGIFTPSQAIKGEKIPNNVLQDIFDKILSVYKEKTTRTPKRIVIHRDGFSREDAVFYKNYFEKKDISYRIVEIKKKVFDRIIAVEKINNNSTSEEKYDYKNPEPGWAFLDSIKNEGLIITSEPINNGSVAPLKICLHDGNLELSLQDAAQQVYNLTKINASSLHDTRLPITIRYADKLSKNVSYVPSGEVLTQLYFL